MATGDQADLFQRLRGLLPPWFGDNTPVLNALLQGLAWAGAFGYSLIDYARLQVRIRTATGGWLDMIAGDFFGDTLQRRLNESDEGYRARILSRLLRPKGTRAGMVQALQELTGNTPTIIEPTRPADTGGYSLGGVGYGVGGAYGSLVHPYQCWLTIARPVSQGVPYVAGYGSPPGGYGVGAIEYASLDMVAGVTDQDIYDTIADTAPAGTIVWTHISP